MLVTLRIQLLFLITIVVCFVTTWRLYETSPKATNEYEYQVPNIVHYIVFNKTSINFITYLSILSVLKIQKPEAVQVHIDNKFLSGHYWRLLNQVDTNTSLHLNYIKQPTHIYGQPLSSIYHASDVARIYVLKSRGGIYLDTDVLVLNNLDAFRRYEVALGCPDNENIGTQVLLSKKNSEFLNLWLEGYKKYHPRDWYFNAGKFPLMLIKQKPSMVHCEKELFGVHNLLDKLYGATKWADWRNYSTIHLLHRHNNVTNNDDNTLVQNMNNTFGDIVNWLLSL